MLLLLLLVSTSSNNLIQIGIHNKVNITDIENTQHHIQLGLNTSSALSILAIIIIILAGSLFYWLHVRRSKTHS